MKKDLYLGIERIKKRGTKKFWRKRIIIEPFYFGGILFLFQRIEGKKTKTKTTKQKKKNILTYCVEKKQKQKGFIIKLKELNCKIERAILKS